MAPTTAAPPDDPDEWRSVDVERLTAYIDETEVDPDAIHTAPLSPLATAPDDIATAPAMAPVIDRLMAGLFDWATSHHARITRSDAQIAKTAGREFERGILIGFWDEDEFAQAVSDDEGGN